LVGDDIDNIYKVYKGCDWSEMIWTINIKSKRFVIGPIIFMKSTRFVIGSEMTMTIINIKSKRFVAGLR